MSVSLAFLPPLCHVIYRLILFTYVSVTVLMKFLVCFVSIFFLFIFHAPPLFATTLPCFDMRDKIYSYYDKYQTNKKNIISLFFSLCLSLLPSPLPWSVQFGGKEKVHTSHLYFYLIFILFSYNSFIPTLIYIQKTPPFSEIVLQFYIFVYFFLGRNGNHV